ncbi:MAG TPA: DUF4976 domain-containing protein, partial [Opitutaceae bacterium]|nr:DUF4976 domain-containing protein [Opitutaceae bacterium]
IVTSHRLHSWDMSVSTPITEQWELYDLRKDPDQVKNVAGDPHYAEMKEELAAQLIGRLKDAGDPRVVGDGKTFDRSPFTDPSGEGPDGRPLKGSAGGRKNVQ